MIDIEHSKKNFSISKAVNLYNKEIWIDIYDTKINSNFIYYE